MTVAEKLTQIAENQQAVYDAGFGEGYDDGWLDGFEDGQADGGSYDEGYADGVYEHFRDYTRRCNMGTNFLYAFAGSGWRNTKTGTDIMASYVPTENMVFDCKTNASNMYAYSGVTDTVATIDLSKATNNVSAAFSNATNMVTIRKLIVSETTPSIGFTGCSKLVNLNVEGTFGKAVNLSACAKLSNASVQNVIDCLKDLTGSTALKLTLHADVGAVVTQAQKDAITAKNWTLAY